MSTLDTTTIDTTVKLGIHRLHARDLLGRPDAEVAVIAQASDIVTLSTKA